MSSGALAASAIGLTVGEREAVLAVTGINASALARSLTAKERVRFRVWGVPHEQAPLWLPVVERSLVALYDLPPNWDTYGSPAIAQRALAAGVKILFSITSRDTAPPMIVPTSVGGIQLEWQSDVVDIEINIAPDGQASLFMQHRNNGRVWEGALNEHEDYVRDFLRPLRPAVLS